MSKTLPQLTVAATIDGEDEFLVNAGGNPRRARISAFAAYLATWVVDAALGDGVTDAYAAIQAALDAAGTTGGDVLLPPGIYLCSNTLAVPSSVHLRGTGWHSIIRNPAGALAGKVLSGTNVYCSIAMVGVTNAKVSRLTLDHRTNGTE